MNLFFLSQIFSKVKYYLLVLLTFTGIIILIAKVRFKAGYNQAALNCQIQTQQQQIVIQNENLKHTQKAKTISKANSFLERNDLIDGL